MIVYVFAFWLVQMVFWMGMMVFVQFFDPGLGRSVQYVTQISHWALVLSCGVAATASWGLVAVRVHHHEQHEQQEIQGRSPDA